jgi:hypothetical protein
MRKNKAVEIVKSPSRKVNWDIVEQLKIGIKERKNEKTLEKL